MKQKLFHLFPALCAAVLLALSALAPSALGADSSSSRFLWVTASDLRDGALSCTLELSGAEDTDSVLISVYGESGRMKRLETYPAAGSVTLELNGVSDTDSVRAVWVQRDLSPVDAAQVYPEGGTSAASCTAETYDEYAGYVADLLQDFSRFSTGAAAESADEYAFARLIVHTDRELPAIPGGHLARRISDGEGTTVLQFDSPAAARTCAAYLQAWLSADSGEYAVPDSLIWADPIESTEGAGAEAALSWGVAVVHADAYAADLARRGITPSVTVAVVDSGLDSGHSFLAGRTVSGWDYVENDGSPQDENMHGTHVSGTVADCTPGLTNIKIMPVRVLDASGYGSSLAVGMGIRYAADNGAAVINLSLGGAHSPSIDKAVEYAVSKNVIVIASAGNEKGPARNSCPAHIASCVTVSAVDSSLNPAGFSNYGPGVDLAAPGVGINSSVPGGGYQSLNGTSMAAPHVSACAAMLHAEFPNLTPAQVEEKLVGAVQKPQDWDAKFGVGAPDKSYGAGVLDMKPFIKDAPSKLYAILYKDGEFVFQNSSTPDSGREVEQSYILKAADGVKPEYTGWESKREMIRKATFREKVRPDSTALWFYGCSNLAAVEGLDKLDLSQVTDMSQMFTGCTGLTELNLSGLDTGKVEDMGMLFYSCGNLRTLDLRGWNTGSAASMEDMFRNCEKLERVYASDSFTVSRVTGGDTMFENCKMLRGGKGTAFNSQHTDKSYARIDGGASNPGYFTDQNILLPDPSQTLYAILYTDGELAFQDSLTPQTGKTARKTWQTDGGGYDGGVYAAWYQERKQIKSVSFETDIYPTSTALWFYGCENLAGFRNMERLHTDHVTDMSQMFSYCSSLEHLDLRGFSTARTVNTNTMFFRCTALREVLASGAFVTEQITDSMEMFYGCTALVGGTGTQYDPKHTDAEYARMDNPPSAPGYFSAA